MSGRQVGATYAMDDRLQRSGVMGEPMCRNLARKSGRRILAFDRAPEPLARLREHGVVAARTLADLGGCAVIFMALPSGRHVEAVCDGADGLLAAVRPGTSWWISDLARGPDAHPRGSLRRAGGPLRRCADRTDAAGAEDGTLSIMVGASGPDFDELRPLLGALATDITHCGPVGSGQIVKILNNMVLVETVAALSEALTLARRAGPTGRCCSKRCRRARPTASPAQPRDEGRAAWGLPERAFSTEYARKDLSYALALGRELGVDVPGATLADDLLRRASEAGYAISMAGAQPDRFRPPAGLGPGREPEWTRSQNPAEPRKA